MICGGTTSVAISGRGCRAAVLRMRLVFMELKECRRQITPPEAGTSIPWSLMLHTIASISLAEMQMQVSRELLLCSLICLIL